VIFNSKRSMNFTKTCTHIRKLSWIPGLEGIKQLLVCCWLLECCCLVLCSPETGVHCACNAAPRPCLAAFLSRRGWSADFSRKISQLGIWGSGNSGAILEEPWERLGTSFFWRGGSKAGSRWAGLAPNLYQKLWESSGPSASSQLDTKNSKTGCTHANKPLRRCPHTDREIIRRALARKVQHYAILAPTRKKRR
jgi:hypothetical protein